MMNKEVTQMRKLNLLLLLVITAATAIGALAQDGVSSRPGQNFNERPRDTRMRFLVRVLGLSEEQQFQMRQITRNQRKLLREAQMRFRQARAEADVAIYADDLDQALVEQRIRQVAMAQAEITKIRMMSEVAVRSVLTPEQLVKFRKIRDENRRRTNQRRALPRQRDRLQRRRTLQRDRPNNQF